MNDNLFDICLSSFYNNNDIDCKTTTQRGNITTADDNYNQANSSSVSLKEPKEDETVRFVPGVATAMTCANTLMKM